MVVLVTPCLPLGPTLVVPFPLRVTLVSPRRREVVIEE